MKTMQNLPFVTNRKRNLAKIRIRGMMTLQHKKFSDIEVYQPFVIKPSPFLLLNDTDKECKDFSKLQK